MARNLAAKLGRLDPKTSLFLLCDMQEKFRPVMKHFDAMVANANKVVKAGKVFNIPLIVTEHYPEKLGKTVKEIDICHAAAVCSKTKFSMATDEVLCKMEEIYGDKLQTVVLFGIECHICIEQTTLDLLERGLNVQLVADGCLSRVLQDRDLALERLRQFGCVVTTSESVIFQLLKEKDNPKFDECRKLVAQPSADVGINTMSKM